MNVSVVFVNNSFMRKINRQFLGQDDSTDVIAFPLADRHSREAEIYVNLDRARTQAREFGASMREEVCRLIIHGVLHLKGYRDKSKREKEAMTLREERYLSFLKGERKQSYARKNR
jgi:rRNA maturation RNase YbeY